MGMPKRFCKRGHDTDIVGRDGSKACKECRRAWDRRRKPERRALEPSRGNRRGKHKPRYSLDWERARVQRWLEIAAEDPMTTMQSTQLRGQQFGERYERLEAGVPTPDDETVDA
jgi:hypothetical protein